MTNPRGSEHAKIVHRSKGARFDADHVRADIKRNPADRGAAWALQRADATNCAIRNAAPLTGRIGVMA
jgi:hypothetical protein